MLKWSGIVLTLSATVGLDYMNESFEQAIKVSPLANAESGKTSVLERLRTTFNQPFYTKGTGTWGQDSSEWFIVFLTTEFASTPRAAGSTDTSPSIQLVYQTFVQDLVRG